VKRARAPWKKALSLAKGLFLFDGKENLPFRLFAVTLNNFSNLEIRFGRFARHH